MKIYISADMEGINGVTSWDEVMKNNNDYYRFIDIMTNEILAACEGANKAGVKEICVKDGHGTGRNIDHYRLPENVRLIRGWSGHPYHMLEYLDKSYDAILFIGYHSPAGANTNPLSHTINSRKIYSITINDQIASEFLINSYTAIYLGVPVVFISGDEGICKIAKIFDENIKSVITKNCNGGSTENFHPNIILNKIRNEVESIFKKGLYANKNTLPDFFKIVIEFKEHFNAYKSSFYPGIKKLSDNKLIYETADYFELLRMLSFILPD